MIVLRPLKRFYTTLWATSGKGSDTINVINTWKTITIDPCLQHDIGWWDYCVLARESLGSPLTVLGSSSSTSISTLLQNGGNEEDIAWYDVFEEICRDKDPSGTGALVALTTTLKKQENEILETYNKIVEVREEGEGVWGGDIDVGRLGELRALSICSYALLNKRS